MSEDLIGIKLLHVYYLILKTEKDKSYCRSIFGKVHHTGFKYEFFKVNCVK